MKLAPLLAKYLFTNKRLDLPGIGTFIFDPTVLVESESSKYNKPGNMEGVSFESNVSANENPDLVGFISSQAGKMKALAAADLDSHLQLAQQFLNIGKPFLFEGIGSLVKLQSGKYEFTAARANFEKNINQSDSDISSGEESVTGYYNIFYNDRRKSFVNKPFYILFFLAGIGLAVWGGYTVYKKTTAKNNSTSSISKKEKIILPEKNREPGENKQKEIQPATPLSIVPAANPTAEKGNFKFVVEVSSKERAFQRFSKLKGWGLNIQMETKDSVSYKLFFVLPASVSDTTKIKDSLGLLYSPIGEKPFIEN